MMVVFSGSVLVWNLLVRKKLTLAWETVRLHYATLRIALQERSRMGDKIGFDAAKLVEQVSVIMEYKIVEALEAKKLQQAVNEHIQDGWEPLGGVAIGCSSISVNWTYCQAMVRKSPK
jgi:hypothetical protein